jgi:hypothetical protein
MQFGDIQLKYLNLLEKKIVNKTKIKLFGKSGGVEVSQTKEIKTLLAAIKVANKTNNLEAVRKIIQPKPRAFAPIFAGFKWSEIDKSPFSQIGSSNPGAAETAAHELCSLEAIRLFMQNNGAYSTEEAFYKKHREDFVKIWKKENARLSFWDKKWDTTYFETAKITQKKVGNTRWGHYSRDDGFMEDVSKLVSRLYGITQKDTWNPADVWLVANYNKEKKYLQDVIKDKQTSIEEFNTELRHKFNDRAIVGVSLKKLTRPPATWELVNLENMDMFYDDEYRFRYDRGICKLNTKGPNGFLQAKDTVIFLDGKRMKAKLAIKQSGQQFSTLRLEGTDVGNNAARLGQVPVRMAEETFKAYGLKWDNEPKNYPKSYAEFIKEQDKYSKMFTFLKRTRMVDLGGVTSQSDFIGNMRLAMTNGHESNLVGAHSKLMQLTMLHEIFSNLTNKSKLEEFWTDMIYNAQKKGKVFGPFSKVY